LKSGHARTSPLGPIDRAARVWSSYLENISVESLLNKKNDLIVSDKEEEENRKEK
jgi:hypothetical protein